jgi:hypothetical protein
MNLSAFDLCSWQRRCKNWLLSRRLTAGQWYWRHLGRSEDILLECETRLEDKNEPYARVYERLPNDYSANQFSFNIGVMLELTNMNVTTMSLDEKFREFLNRDNDVI